MPLNLLETTTYVPPPFGTYRTKARFLLLIFFLLSLLPAPLSASTKVLRRWVLTGQPLPKLKKILVIAVLENYLIRQEFEDEMEKLLAKSSIEGVRSHMVLPSREEYSESEIKDWIIKGDFDGVLIIRPVDMRTESKEIVTSVAGSYYVPPMPYYTFWPYWHMAASQVHSTSSYFQENTIVSAEFNLYSTKDEKLLWSGETDTVYSKDFGKLAKGYAKTMFKQLKKDKVIGAK